MPASQEASLQPACAVCVCACACVSLAPTAHGEEAGVCLQWGCGAWGDNRCGRCVRSRSARGVGRLRPPSLGDAALPHMIILAPFGSSVNRSTESRAVRRVTGRPQRPSSVLPLQQTRPGLALPWVRPRRPCLCFPRPHRGQGPARQRAGQGRAEDSRELTPGPLLLSTLRIVLRAGCHPYWPEVLGKAFWRRTWAKGVVVH